MGKNQRFLPGRPGHVGANARDNRLFVEAVLYRYRAGVPWRDLPERFGGFRVVHTREGARKLLLAAVEDEIQHFLKENAGQRLADGRAAVVVFKRSINGRFSGSTAFNHRQCRFGAIRRRDLPS